MKVHFELTLDIEADCDYSTDFGYECDITKCLLNNTDILSLLTLDEKEELEEQFLLHSSSAQ